MDIIASLVGVNIAAVFGLGFVLAMKRRDKDSLFGANVNAPHTAETTDGIQGATTNINMGNPSLKKKKKQKITKSIKKIIPIEPEVPKQEEGGNDEEEEEEEEGKDEDIPSYDTRIDDANHPCFTEKIPYIIEIRNIHYESNNVEKTERRREIICTTLVPLLEKYQKEYTDRASIDDDAFAFVDKIILIAASLVFCENIIDFEISMPGVRMQIAMLLLTEGKIPSDIMHISDETLKNQNSQLNNRESVYYTPANERIDRIFACILDALPIEYNNNDNFQESLKQKEHEIETYYSFISFHRINNMSGNKKSSVPYVLFNSLIFPYPEQYKSEAYLMVDPVIAQFNNHRAINTICSLYIELRLDIANKLKQMSDFDQIVKEPLNVICKWFIGKNTEFQNKSEIFSKKWEDKTKQESTPRSHEAIISEAYESYKNNTMYQFLVLKEEISYARKEMRKAFEEFKKQNEAN